MSGATSVPPPGTPVLAAPIVNALNAPRSHCQTSRCGMIHEASLFCDRNGSGILKC